MHKNIADQMFFEHVDWARFCPKARINMEIENHFKDSKLFSVPGAALLISVIVLLGLSSNQLYPSSILDKRYSYIKKKKQKK